jgi:hypothetical protein
MVSSINRLAQNRKYFLRQRRKAGPAPLPVDATIEGLTMTTEEQLREKLRKIQALFEGATSIGERHAAAAAIERIRKALGGSERSERAERAERAEPAVEFRFSIPDPWQRRLFLALCRRYGLRPFRYKRQRYATVVVRAPASFVNRTLWPEYVELRDALNSYLNEATERIIREEVFGDAGEASERAV